MPAPVYYSIVEIPGDGVTTQHEFSFAGGYIRQDHVKAYTQDADGVITPVTVTGGMFVTAGTLDLGVAAPVGGLTRIYRDTPKDEPLANFTGGSRITEANLDLLAAQTVFAVAEAFDAGAYAVVNDLLGAAGAAAAAAEAAAASAAADAAAAAASAESVDLSTKADIAGDDFTGPITVPAGATGTQVPRVQEVAKLTGAVFTGTVEAPAILTTSLNGDQTGGIRSLVRNGKFTVNQDKVGSATLAADAYWLDGWRAGSGGATVSFAAGGSYGSGVYNVVTITAGTLVQDLYRDERRADVYTLAWEGTALGAIDDSTPTYSNVHTATLNGPTSSIYRATFGVGTVALPRMYPGTVVQPFEFIPDWMELLRSQRTYVRTTALVANAPLSVCGFADSTTRARFVWTPPVPMLWSGTRLTPTITSSATSTLQIVMGGTPVNVTVAPTASSGRADGLITFDVFVASGLVDRAGCYLRGTTTSAYIAFDQRPLINPPV